MVRFRRSCARAQRASVSLYSWQNRPILITRGVIASLMHLMGLWFIMIELGNQPHLKVRIEWPQLLATSRLIPNLSDFNVLALRGPESHVNMWIEPQLWNHSLVTKTPMFYTAPISWGSPPTTQGAIWWTSRQGVYMTFTSTEIPRTQCQSRQTDNRLDYVGGGCVATAW
jgi:hypothetical protein